MRWLGNMSYSYYLLHGLALQASFLMLDAIVPAAERGPSFFWGWLPIMFASTLIPTLALFLLVERPYSLLPRRMGAGGGGIAQRSGTGFEGEPYMSQATVPGIAPRHKA
jgi:peptidoglycan/LPS O-acetylase OafA/YrhL